MMHVLTKIQWQIFPAPCTPYRIVQHGWIRHCVYYMHIHWEIFTNLKSWFDSSIINHTCIRFRSVIELFLKYIITEKFVELNYNTMSRANRQCTMKIIFFKEINTKLLNQSMSMSNRKKFYHRKWTSTMHTCLHSLLYITYYSLQFHFLHFSFKIAKFSEIIIAYTEW